MFISKRREAPKLSRPRKDPQPRNDPQTGPEIIPNWTRNDPEVNLGMVWRPSVCVWTLNFFCHIYFNDKDKISNKYNDN